MYPETGPWYLVPGTRDQVPQVPGARDQVPGTRYQVPGTRCLGLAMANTSFGGVSEAPSAGNPPQSFVRHFESFVRHFVHHLYAYLGGCMHFRDPSKKTRVEKLRNLAVLMRRDL